MMDLMKTMSELVAGSLASGISKGLCVPDSPVYPVRDTTRAPHTHEVKLKTWLNYVRCPPESLWALMPSRKTAKRDSERTRLALLYNINPEIVFGAALDTGIVGGTNKLPSARSCGETEFLC